jgi:hypothetical protein
MARPMPVAPPVTMAVFPLSIMQFSPLSSLWDVSALRLAGESIPQGAARRSLDCV